MSNGIFWIVIDDSPQKVERHLNELQNFYDEIEVVSSCMGKNDLKVIIKGVLKSEV